MSCLLTNLQFWHFLLKYFVFFLIVDWCVWGGKFHLINLRVLSKSVKDVVWFGNTDTVTTRACVFFNGEPKNFDGFV